MHFLCVLYLTTVKNFQNLQGFLWKATEAWLGGKSYFSHTNPFNFQRPLQSLYTAENLLVTKIWYALSFPTEKIFQKRTIFVFTESWSRDPLLQKKKKKPHRGMGSLGRGVPLRPENFDFCYPNSSPGCFSLAFATMFKTQDHFSWPLFLSF